MTGHRSLDPGCGKSTRSWRCTSRCVHCRRSSLQGLVVCPHCGRNKQGSGRRRYATLALFVIAVLFTSLLADGMLVAVYAASHTDEVSDNDPLVEVGGAVASFFNRPISNAKVLVAAFAEPSNRPSQPEAPATTVALVPATAPTYTPAATHMLVATYTPTPAPTASPSLTATVAATATEVATAEPAALPTATATLAATATLVATAVPEPANPSAVVVAPVRINIRSGPGIAFSVIDGADPGEQFVILGKDATGRWVRLSGAKERWAATSGLKVTGTAPLYERAAETSAGPPSPTPAGEISSARVVRQALNVRSGPGTNHAIVGALRQGDRVAISAKDPTGLWLRLSGEAERWVLAAAVAMK